MKDPQIRYTGMRESAAPTPINKGDGEPIQTVERRFLDHFGLAEQPFGVTPDPRFLYLGPKHRQALTALNYGTDLNRGFLTLIAPPGMGKTSLLFQYMEGLRNKTRTAFLFQTDGDSRDLMRHLLADLDLEGEGKDLPEMRLILNQFLTREMNAGRSFILVVDEAQNLDEKVLESVRLLSNFETPWMKLMQIILAGQPQLAERLAKPEMAQLRQRVSFSIRIEPLTREEVAAYVAHRLWVAGYKNSTLFSPGAQCLLGEYSQGIPRNVNNICFSAMSLAWALKQKNIDRDMMRDVLSDMDYQVPRAQAEPEAKIVEPAKPAAPLIRPAAHAAPEPPAGNRPQVEPPKEKASVAPRIADQPKPFAPPRYRAAVLTVKEPPAGGKLAKVAFAGVVLVALGWAGVQFGINKQFDASWRSIMELVKGSSAPAAAPPPAAVAPVPVDSAAQPSSGSASSDARSELPADNRNTGMQPTGSSESIRKGHDSN
ncbi:MAG: AAA family ATPase [Acidobacteriia bacterium]|nr:AAA family ATPase [Terriglobia bacterium]